jgi:hypothetical protein
VPVALQSQRAAPKPRRQQTTKPKPSEPAAPPRLRDYYDSIANATAQTGIPAAILRAAKRGGCPAFRSNRFYILDFLGWFWSDDHVGLGTLEEEKIRLTRAEANVRELEERKLRGELVELGGAEHLYTEAILPVRQRIIALPTEACARCNPSDPQLAREALAAWVDDALPLIRKQLPKPMSAAPAEEELPAADR